MLFYIIGLGMIICPRQNVLSEGEINARNTLSDPYVAIFGKYYRIPDIIQSHVNQNQWISGVAMAQTVLGRGMRQNYCNLFHGRATIISFFRYQRHVQTYRYMVHYMPKHHSTSCMG